MSSVVYVYALASAIGFGIASVIYSRFSSQVSPLWVNTFKALVATFGFLIASILLGEFETPPELGAFLFLFASGVVGLNIGDIFLLKAFTVLGPGRTLMVFSFEPLVLGYASLLFLGQAVTDNQVIAIGFLFGCAFFIALGNFRATKKWGVKGLAFAFLGVCLDALGLLLSRAGFDRAPEIQIFEGNLYRCFGAMLGFILVSRFIRISLIGRFREMKSQDRLLMIGGSLMGSFIALYFWLAAIRQGNLASVAAVGGTAPAFAMAIEAVVQRRWPNRYVWIAFFFFASGFYFLTIHGTT